MLPQLVKGTQDQDTLKADISAHNRTFITPKQTFYFKNAPIASCGWEKSFPSFSSHGLVEKHEHKRDCFMKNSDFPPNPEGTALSTAIIKIQQHQI